MRRGHYGLKIGQLQQRLGDTPASLGKRVIPGNNRVKFAAQSAMTDASDALILERDIISHFGLFVDGVAGLFGKTRGELKSQCVLV